MTPDRNTLFGSRSKSGPSSPSEDLVPSSVSLPDGTNLENVSTEECQSKSGFIGNVKGTKVCIDNLGWAFDKSQLITELKQHLTEVKTITLASTSIRGISIHFGYGCIEFESFNAAVAGMLKLDSLYLDCPGSPFPRPILSHFPEWEINLWGKGDMPGYIIDNRTSPHFCQKNTIEMQVALEWKHLQKSLKIAKMRLCDIFVRRISQILLQYKSASEQDMLNAFHEANYQLPGMSVLVYKGVSIQMKNATVRDLMEMSDQCTITRAQCPVTGLDKGCVFVDITDHAKAVSIVEDMKNYLFCLGKSPRPAEVDILRIGPPSGFEGVFDRAVESAFNVKMEYLKQSLFTNSHVVDISSWRNEKKDCCMKIRSLMESMQPIRYAWKLEANSNRVDLHERQEEWIHNEIRKLEKLENVSFQIGEKENNRG
eukprot:g1200.t1